MTKYEAKSLAAQLGFEVKSVSAFETALDERGLEIGLESPSGDWVVLEKGNKEKVLARCA